MHIQCVPLRTYTASKYIEALTLWNSFQYFAIWFVLVHIAFIKKYMEEWIVCRYYAISWRCWRTVIKYKECFIVHRDINLVIYCSCHIHYWSNIRSCKWLLHFSYENVITKTLNVKEYQYRKYFYIKKKRSQNVQHDR